MILHIVPLSVHKCSEENNMSNKVNALLNELGLPTEDAAVLHNSIWTTKGIVRPGTSDLFLCHHGERTRMRASSMQRSKLLAILTSPEEMAEVINYLATSICQQVIGLSYMEIDQPTISGNRVIVVHQDDVYRINLVTFNVTKFINGEWIIQPPYKDQSKDIDNLHSVLIQCNML